MNINRQARRKAKALGLPVDEWSLPHTFVACRTCGQKNHGNKCTRDGDWMREHLHDSNKTRFDWQVGDQTSYIEFSVDAAGNGSIECHVPGAAPYTRSAG